MNTLTTKYEIPERIESIVSDKNVVTDIQSACSRVAPLWTLKHFVAVNPFWGLKEMPFPDALEYSRRVSHSPLRMSGAYYKGLADKGQITAESLQMATQAVPDCHYSLEQLNDALNDEAPNPISKVQTLADFLDSYTEANYASTITRNLADFCARYFDEGQALWHAPYADQPLFSAWRECASLDYNPELKGIRGLRSLAGKLPDEPRAVIQKALQMLNVYPAMRVEFLHRQLMSIQGWTGYCRRLQWEANLNGETNDLLEHLLAARLVYEMALFPVVAAKELTVEWVGAQAPVAEQKSDTTHPLDIWQEAHEITWKKKLATSLTEAKPTTVRSRASAQVVFCIDVRSEVFRRSLETVAPEVETLGFAGFFGFATSFKPFGHEEGVAHCPVLLKPKMVVCEDCNTLAHRHELKARRADRLQVKTAMTLFKTSAVSSFSYVEALGLGYGWRLLRDTFGLNGGDSKVDGLSEKERANLKVAPKEPAIDNPKAYAEVAAGALRNMELTRDFARLVLICGHGSTTHNNPYTSALDCGACGGNAGGQNARLAAMILNDSRVRSELAALGIHIPEHTHFLAGQHDTTTDIVKFYDLETVPGTHKKDIEILERQLQQARTVALSCRASKLGLQPTSQCLAEAVELRSRDWAQVRPEWGLAGNLAFIAAPRWRTSGIDLGGRAFLHNYDPAQDPTCSTLELILCAPMVVANWINMQYFASTVDNERFGSGSKVTHNVVGATGVVQGNGGDLKTGLPWQSLHDGQQFVHDPIRLQVFIEAAPHNVDAIISRQETVRHLVENQWVRLHVINPRDGSIYERRPHGEWTAIA